MDFARKQLEKYGWSEGKGLGKHEDGISEALKTKMKRSVTGLGHDAASDFTEHWWTTLYDKAAGNIKVKQKNGKTKKIETESNNFEITNSEWKLKRKKKDSKSDDEYQSFFVKKAILSNGGFKTEKLKESDSEEETVETKDVVMTDEELFKACGGRTAHKGARHGLKAIGKLARIEAQEKLLLREDRFNGYSHKKKLKSQEVEDTDLNSEPETKSKKKKKKYCNREISNEEADCAELLPKKKKSKKLAGNQDGGDKMDVENEKSNDECTDVPKKKKKKKYSEF